ncbi:MAG: fructosamine kinase family protein [Enterococcus sp.]
MNVETILKELNFVAKTIPISGGDVNQTYRVEEENQTFFLKIHPGVKKEFFEKEVAGLKKLAPYVRVPETYLLGETTKGAYLLMEWIEPGTGDQRELATSLASLHHVTAQNFGFYTDNYLGTLPQNNQWNDNWWDFFFSQRIEPQIIFAQQTNRWNERRQQHYEQLKEHVLAKWGDLSITASLIHGDLWSGNVFFDTNGQPVFIDPSVSFSNREQDIAMSQLFGGFRPEFLKTYQDFYPLEQGFEDRIPIYQLYYLLAHLNMFGESYGAQVDQILMEK